MNATPTAPQSGAADELVRRYEALRHPAEDGTDDDRGARALMMHQGVAAWIEAWAHSRAPASPVAADVSSARAGANGPPSPVEVLPVGARSQVVRILTGMAVAGLRGRSSCE
jgi:hypothetical protein